MNTSRHDPGHPYALLFLLAALLVSLPAVAFENAFNWSGYRWTVPDISDWQIAGGGILHLAKARGPLPGPRRPIQFALAETAELSTLTMDVDAMPLQRSLMLVFAYRDSAHFDYAHLSIDPASSEPHHNGIFHVYGGERVRISAEAGPAAFPATRRWYHVKLLYTGRTGEVRVAVDNQWLPALQAVDRSLSAGKVGLGSFDETADFKNLHLNNRIEQ